MKALMLTTERFFTNTLIEAEQLVAEKKQEHGTSIKQHIIAKRHKKDVEFFIVTVVIEYYKPADLVVTD